MKWIHSAAATLAVTLVVSAAAAAPAQAAKECVSFDGRTNHCLIVTGAKEAKEEITRFVITNPNKKTSTATCSFSNVKTQTFSVTNTAGASLSGTMGAKVFGLAKAEVTASTTLTASRSVSYSSQSTSGATTTHKIPAGKKLTCVLKLVHATAKVTETYYEPRTGVTTKKNFTAKVPSYFELTPKIS